MKRILTLLPVLGAALAGQLHATILTVPSASYPTVTTALAACTSGDTIRVSAGTYSTNSGEVFPLIIDTPLTLEALYATNPPTLQGDGLHTVVLVESPGVTVRGLHITGGCGSEGIYGMDGGGICIFVDEDASGSVLITDCLIEGNTCPFDETYNGCGGGIYCGGTWCTCFEIGIINCTIRGNGIPLNNGLFGNGGGVFCGMLSKVWIEDCTLDGNSANDRGGGLFVDSYGLAMLKTSHVRNNISPGDPSRAGWGGKGGGVFLDGEAVCTVIGCDITGNAALYYGGGLFTMSGLTNTATGGLCTNAGIHFFTMPVLSNVVSASLVASNTASVSGGGAYIRDHAYLAFRMTTNYWNDALSDGGGVCVAGTASGGGRVEFTDHCLLEGNECAGRGAGVFLGTSSLGTFHDTRFLGNSSDGDGGAAFLDRAACATLTNCLVTYNNAARGYGGAFRLFSTASARLQHCSVVGNFAPWARSGFCLDTNAILAVTNSILWRNAGGSIETNGGNVQIAFSLNDNPDPLFVGWGTKSNLYVDSAVAHPGTGTAADPYDDLQIGLDGFDFRLATNSPCIGSASNGGNQGATAGTGGAAGFTVATLNLTNGIYDIRGRNVIFTQGLQGNGSTNCTIYNAVFGYIENSFIRDLGIAGERWFGGLLLRGNATMDRCRVCFNTALKDGGGIYVCRSNTLRLANCAIAQNVAKANGGGLFLSVNALAILTTNVIELNTSIVEGGGVYSLGTCLVTNSLIARNTSTAAGGGMRLSGVAAIDSSLIASNTAHNHGAGIYVSGDLVFNLSTNLGNRVDTWYYHGGGMYVAPSAVVEIVSSQFLTNIAAGAGGGLMVNDGKTHVYSCSFLGNNAYHGGAVFCGYSLASPKFEDCKFAFNTAWNAGGVYAVSWCHPFFLNCLFDQNSSGWAGGAGIAESCYATFDRCSFTSNKAEAHHGGALHLQGSASQVLNCGFTNNSAISASGGSVNIQTGDTSWLVGCRIVASQAGDSGGGINIRETSHPTMIDVLLVNNRAAANGGGIACRETAVSRFDDVTIGNCTAILGGGVYADGTTVSAFQRCWFLNNTATNSVGSPDGGGANFTGGAVGWLSCCWFSGNTALDDGGAFSVSGTGASVSLTNCILMNNQAVNSGGGAHFTLDGSGTFQNCTIVSNQVQVSNGGGTYREASCRVALDSSIVYWNQPDGMAQSGGPVSVNYSCIQEPWSGTSNIINHPLLDPTMLLLFDGSPCIDAGNPSPLLTDASSPPGKGTLRNDIGASGGPRNGCALAMTPQWFITTAGAWKFWDRGQTPPGNWRELNYSDSEWSSGFAKFGAGSDGEVTIVNLGTNTEQRYITTYFRRAFIVTDAASVASLEARLICDDGAVLHLNGAEAARYNMPGGNVNFTTLASNAVTGADENRWISLPLNPGLLVEGWNVVAVEVHQAAPNSGDLGFNLQLASAATFAVVPRPRTIYVNDDSTAGDVFTSAVGNDNNPGTVPELPLRNLGTAFQRFTLEPGDTVYLDAGLYAEPLVIGSSNRGFSVIGAGPDRSLIDGGLSAPCLVLDQVQGVTLKDLCLRRGKGVPRIHDLNMTYGGALLTIRSDVLLQNVALRDSTANYGGGAFFEQSDVVVRDSLASGNWATNNGGGLYLHWTTEPGTGILVTNCLLTNNQADAGGGMFVVDSLVQACTMIGNTASYYGGAVALEYGSRIEGCLLTANRAAYAGGLHLAHWAVGRDCIIRTNTASIDGGGLRTWSSTPLSNCVFIGNIATNAGGGANIWDSASVRNCTFIANGAAWAGGLTIDGSATAFDCVIVSNTASLDGGGFRMSGSTSVSNCFVAGNSATNTGGGANLWDSATVRNCTFAANRANWAGGLSVSGNAAARDCVITNNAATGESGGLRAWDSATFSNCLIVANQAPSAGGLSIHQSARGQACVITNNTATDAGGLRLYDSAWVSNCSLSGNVATNWGGGAVVHHSCYLADCAIWSNRATWGGGLDMGNTAMALDCVISNNTASTDGGGAYLWDSASVSNCSVVANSALANSGGGVYCQSSGSVLNCLVSGNTAPGTRGGGVCLASGGRIRNSLLSGNSGNYGGALYLNAGTAENCTIAANTAGKGGGLYLDSGRVTNTIIYFNQSINGSNYYNNSLNYAYSHCCTAPDVPDGIGIIVANPRFRNLAGGDFALATNSPCLDAGNYCPWMTNAFDLDGKPRLVNSIVDLGAYEAMPMWSDSDGDRLPDWWEWEYSHSLTGMAPPDDPDGDGQTNLEEYRLGHNPLVWDNLHFVACQYLLDGRTKLTVFGQVGSNYTLSASTNLVNWTPLFVFACTNATVDVFDSDARNFKSRFYRVGPRTSVSGMQLRLGSAQPLGSNGFDMVLLLSPGTSCRIEASSDLLNWTTITNLLSTNVTTYFRDPVAVNHRQRFYRAVPP
jgi:hypothetical protein